MKNNKTAKQSDSFIIKGDICWSKNPTELETIEDGFLVCIDGKSAGGFKNIPEEYLNLPIRDYSGKLVIPGMVDLHTHAPQYAFRGLGMDLELLDWLQAYTFPEEAKYANLEYAKKAYNVFVSNLKRSATTRAVIFATVHRDATILLMDMLEDSGIVSYVGKVNMDRDAPDNLREPSAEFSASFRNRPMRPSRNVKQPRVAISPMQMVRMPVFARVSFSREMFRAPLL